MSIANDKKQIPLLNLLVNCVSARSAPQTLSMIGDCAFLLLNFQIISLCNLSASCWSDILSFLIPLAEVFLSKNL